MRIACWIPKATNTHADYVIFIASLRQNGGTKAPQFHVIRALPVLSVTDDTEMGYKYSVQTLNNTMRQLP